MPGPGSSSAAPPDGGGGFRILFVCTANVCRSPAAALLAAYAAGWLVTESAGTRALLGADVHPATAAALRARGIDPAAHTARDITRSMVEKADLVLVMTRAHRADVVRLCPPSVRRAFTVREFARLAAHAPPPGPQDSAAWVDAVGRLRGAVDGADDDVPDPVRGPDAMHAEVVTMIEDALALPLQRLAAAAGVRRR